MENEGDVVERSEERGSRERRREGGREGGGMGGEEGRGGREMRVCRGEEWAVESPTPTILLLSFIALHSLYSTSLLHLHPIVLIELEEWLRDIGEE